MASGRVAGFQPSLSGWLFPNSFPRAPVLKIPLPFFGGLPIGNAAGGLCGGMAFTVRDFFEASRKPPRHPEPPPVDSPLFRFLARRLFDSFHLPQGVAKYYAWMNFPDGDTSFVRGLAWRTITREWPRIQNDLDAGTLSPLGLVRVRSARPIDLGRNHQVLAYGYDLDEDDNLTIHLYDPNYPGADDVSIALNVSTPSRCSSISYSTGEPLRGFFRTPYRFWGFGDLGTASLSSHGAALLEPVSLEKLSDLAGGATGGSE